MSNLSSSNSYFDELLALGSQASSAVQADAAAMKNRRESGGRLAAFTAIFDETGQDVLLAQLGNYAATAYGGNPWSLPGGGVGNEESPSHAACRELREETGAEIQPDQLKLAAWLSRPYIRQADKVIGETIFLFAARCNRQRLDAPIRCATTCIRSGL